MKQLPIKPDAEPASAFSQQLGARFFGVIRWQDLDALWQRVLAEPEGWYASLTGKVLPAAPLTADALQHFVAEVDALLRREHKEDYCGIVYADDLERPSFIKIYDPNNLGSSCGMHGGAYPPRWLLSRLRPERIVDPAPLPSARRRWWQSLFGGSPARAMLELAGRLLGTPILPEAAA